jgi:hypothetical protein
LQKRWFNLHRLVNLLLANHNTVLLVVHIFKQRSQQFDLLSQYIYRSTGRVKYIQSKAKTSVTKHIYCCLHSVSCIKQTIKSSIPAQIFIKQNAIIATHYDSADSVTIKKNSTTSHYRKSQLCWSYYLHTKNANIKNKLTNAIVHLHSSRVMKSFNARPITNAWKISHTKIRNNTFTRTSIANKNWTH